MMGVLTPRKVTVCCNVEIDNGSNNDDLPLVRHNARVDLNPGGARICYTQDRMVDRTVYDNVLVLNHNYKGKECAELTSSNPAPKVQRRCPPAKIRAPPGIMEFNNNNDTEEEKDKTPGELVATLK
jgi:hypothetical protein